MLRGLWLVLVSIAATLVCALAAVAGGMLAPSLAIPNRAGRRWAQAHLWALGLKPDYCGSKPPDEVEPRIFTANHLSVVDIWVMLYAIPLNARFVAKASLFRIPLFGWAMRMAGFIPIDRADRNRAMNAVSKAGEALRSGKAIIMFPEGTRSRDGRLLRFKKGAFHLALSERVPIVPVAISGSGRMIKPHSIVVQRIPVSVRFLEPVDVTPYLPDDVDGLITKVRAAIIPHLAADERPEPVTEAVGAAS